MSIKTTYRGTVSARVLGQRVMVAIHQVTNEEGVEYFRLEHDLGRRYLTLDEAFGAAQFQLQEALLRAANDLITTVLGRR